MAVTAIVVPERVNELLSSPKGSAHPFNPFCTHLPTLTLDIVWCSASSDKCQLQDLILNLNLNLNLHREGR